MMLQAKMVVNECYILQTRLGEDTYTEHWVATAIFSAKRFLLRFLKNNTNAECLEALRKEAMRCYRVRGPSIADFIEVDLYKDLLFISSEYHDDIPLSSISAKKGSWRIEQICLFILSMARGLDAFHSQGIVYGTLNAENVLVENNGMQTAGVKIQKPGMLSMLPVLPDDKISILENFAYIAPEYRSRKELTEGSDVFSLGMHMVRFFTGRLPFDEPMESSQELLTSLRYVTNALLRRGIREDLVRIVLRALMPDPSRRYSSCKDMVADLRYFMKKAQIGSPEMQDYFRNPKNRDKKDIAPLYPLDPCSDQDTLLRLERQELKPLTEEAVWSIDDYIEQGLRIIAGEKGRNYFGMDEFTLGIVPVDLIDDAFRVEASIDNNAAVIEPIPEGTPADIPAKALAGEEPVFQEKEGIPHARKKRTGIKQNTKKDISHASNQMIVSGISVEKSVNWNYHRVQLSDVWKVVECTVKMAEKGKGSFRYMQEPSPGRMNTDLFHSFEALRKSCLYINTGTCARYGKASLADFLRMLRYGLAREISVESGRSLAKLAQRVKKADTFGVFNSAPLGQTLYGKHTAEPSAESLRNVECRESTIRSIFAFGTKKRPLVLVIRGGESIQRDLHDLFNVFAAGIHDVPVCVFVFFEHARFESWHALSSIPKR